MEYVGPDNRRHRPYMIHRALLGSIERFTGILLEHYAGALPVWLSPVQVKLIPIGEAHTDYTKKLENRLKEEDLRVEIDDRAERLNAKIRDAELQKIPYVIVIGDKEVSQGKISVRSKKEGNLGSMSVEEFIKHIKDRINSKAP
jgi:threonyl-tRNA synthetase